MLGGRMELGLVPGINADYFRPFGLDYNLRKSPTLEFVDYLRAAFGKTQPFSFHGNDFHTASAIPRTEAHVIRHFQERMPYG
jgi:alkanesulfonate monooxygenase SsuD/methylene tetrahydromethanopterin reductase-like flavin-dependent oxidoreductase (luciferase family)